MNILIRIENRDDIIHIEESVAALPLDLYFVRDDSHMLSILEQSPFDAVLVGFSSDRNAVSHTIRQLKEHEIGATIPVLRCCGYDKFAKTEPLDDALSNFEQFESVIKQSYSVEVLWQSRFRSRSAYSQLTC